MVVPNFFKKYFVHIAIWALMLAYLALAPSVYARLSIHRGNPAAQNFVLPQPTGRITGRVDQLNTKKIEGQELHLAWGWSLIPDAEDLSQYERFLVLKSDQRTYFFPMTASPRKDVQAAFPEVKADALNSGYIAEIAKESIQIGTYTVGVLYRHTATGEMLYQLFPTKHMIRTPNQLALEVVK